MTPTQTQAILTPVVTNAHDRPAHRNPLRGDPSRTATIRRQWSTEMRRRFRSLKRKITELLVTEDAFGLKKNKNPLVLQSRFAFQTDSEKVKSYRAWLKEQVDADILQVTGDQSKPWTNRYVDSAYKKGAVRAYTDTHAESLAEHPSFYAGSKDQFLRDAFNQPEMLSKLEFLQTRVFEELKGIDATMSQNMGRIFADGLANGDGPRTIARRLHKSMDNIERKRALVMARTETARAHAEGQLQGFQQLGVENIKVMAEWSTAGDDRVCPQCQPLDGVVMTIKEAEGIIPRHPNCRCAWIPANVGEPTKGQKRSKGAIDQSVGKSLRDERVGKRTTKEARASSTWVGADKKFRKLRPKRFNVKLPKKQVGRVAGQPNDGAKIPEFFGADSTQLLRQLGGEGFTLEEATALMESAGLTLKPVTIKGAWKQGVVQKFKGKVAKLTQEQLAVLRERARAAVGKIVPPPVIKPPIKKIIKPKLDVEKEALEKLGKLKTDKDGDILLDAVFKKPTNEKTPFIVWDEAEEFVIDLSKLRHSPQQDFVRKGSVEYWIKNPNVVGRSPKVILTKEGELVINDGHHRLVASKLRGVRTAKVQLGIEKGVTDAQLKEALKLLDIKPKPKVVKLKVAKPKPEVKKLDGGAWEKSLTAEERNAISKYTGTEYHEVRHCLQDPITCDDAIIKTIQHMKTAMNKAAGVKKKLYRGLKWNESSDVKEFIAQLQKSGTMEIESFMSTTSSKAVAEKFANYQSGMSVVVEIEGANGVNLIKLSGRPDEKEFLFNIGSKFEYVSHKKLPGFHNYQVKLRQIGIEPKVPRIVKPKNAPPPQLTAPKKVDDFTKKVWKEIGEEGIKTEEHARKIGKLIREEAEKIAASPSHGAKVRALRDRMDDLDEVIAQQLRRPEGTYQHGLVPGNRKLMERLRNQMTALEHEGGKALDVAYRDTLARVRSMGKGRVKVAKGSKSVADMKSLTKKSGEILPTDWSNQVNEAADITFKKIKRGHFNRGYETDLKREARIAISGVGAEASATMTHELTHAVEMANAHLRKKTRRLVAKRLDAEARQGAKKYKGYIDQDVIEKETKKELKKRGVGDLESLQKQFKLRRAKGEAESRLYPWAADGSDEALEFGMKDEFTEHYMGKVYHRGPYTYESHEILTMGVEGTMHNKYRLTADTDYTDFILGIMGGL